MEGLNKVNTFKINRFLSIISNNAIFSKKKQEIEMSHTS